MKYLFAVVFHKVLYETRYIKDCVFVKNMQHFIYTLRYIRKCYFYVIFNNNF
jgi:hypothetical protein